MVSTPLFAIPPGQEELMARMFHRACRLPREWKFENAGAIRTHLRARYRHADGDLVTLLLEHPFSATSAGDAATPRFSIRIAESRPERDCGSLLEAVCVSVAAAEREWRWCDRGAHPEDVGHCDRGEYPVDIELCALLAGVKPCVRITVRARDLEQIVRRYRSAGVAVSDLGRTVPVRGHDVAVLYAALAQPAADELRDLESTFFRLQSRNASPAEEHHYNTRIGELLGYPRCCIESFCSRAGAGARLDDMYRAARAAWVPLPYARLNTTLLPVGRSLISFEPCTYDCAAASRIADRIAETLEDNGRRELDSVLSRAVLVHPSGMCAWIEIDAGTAPWIISATAVPHESGGAADDSDIALSREFVGRPIEPNGVVRPSSGCAAVALDFASRDL